MAPWRTLLTVVLVVAALGASGTPGAALTFSESEHTNPQPVPPHSTTPVETQPTTVDESGSSTDPGPTTMPVAGDSTSRQSIAYDPVTLSAGHADVVAVRSDGTMLEVLVKDGTGPGIVWRDPASVLLAVTDGARREVPADPAFSFLGSVGAPTWILPQVQDPSLLWPGWSTEAIGAGVLAHNRVTWRLEAVTGPGAFALFATDQFGAPNVIFSSMGGLPDEIHVPVGTHAHANWAFSTPGRYRLDMTVSASGAGGSALSDRATLTFEVGDVPPDAAPGAPPAGADGVPQAPGAGSQNTSASGDADATPGSGPSGSTNSPDAAESGSDARPGSGDGGGTLPETGADAATAAGLGALLVLAGSGLVGWVNRAGARRTGEGTAGKGAR